MASTLLPQHLQIALQSLQLADPVGHMPDVLIEQRIDFAAILAR